jgi:hypothetical protein
MRASLLILAVQLYGVAPVYGDDTYRAPQRIDTIGRALKAVKTTGRVARDDLTEFIHVAARSTCRSNAASLKANCMVKAVQTNCEQRGGDVESCHVVSDVLIVNRLSEREFITSRRRYVLMKEAKDVRAAILGELMSQYARLVTEFRLSAHYEKGDDDPAVLEKGIDSYCLEVADERGLSWQHCAAAIIWFIGTTS